MLNKGCDDFKDTCPKCTGSIKHHSQHRCCRWHGGVMFKNRTETRDKMTRVNAIIITALLLMVSCAPVHEEMAHEDSHSIKTMRVHADQDTLELHDFTLTFMRPAIEAGKEAHLEFTLMEGDKPVDLEMGHGALMHIIIVSKDLDHFYHIHGEPTKEGVLDGHIIFEDPGEYRMWIEFLSNDMRHIIDYDITVNEST